MVQSSRTSVASDAPKFPVAALSVEPSSDAIFVAGQAVVACIEGLEIERMEHRSGEGNVWMDVEEPELPAGHIWNHRDRTAVKSMIRALLAGPAAQERYSFGAAGIGSLLGSENAADEECVRRATNLAGRMKAGISEVEPLWTEVCALISRADVWIAVERVAASLAATEELVGCEIEEIVWSIVPRSMR